VSESASAPEGAGARRPLDGVRVLAIEQMQALPYGTQLLGRFGADVVKVEPRTGESGRGALPAMTDPYGSPVGSTFLRNNLGKRSVAIDLKHPAGHDLVLRLAPRFDVVCENFKAGTIGRLGLDYEDIRAVHPSVIYLSVSGFGRGPGPYDGMPAYAPVAEAMGGLYDFKPVPGVPPTTSPVGSLGDTATSLFAVIGVLTALFHREATGEGQFVDVAMYDSMVALNDAGINYWSMGIDNAGNAPLVNHTFAARDGYFVLQVLRRPQFEALADLIGCGGWKTDPVLATPADWLAHVDDIVRPAVEQWAASRTKLDASVELGRAGIPAGPVHRQADVVSDPHVAARKMVVSMARSDGIEQPILSPGNPVKLSGMPEAAEARVPWCGEHTVDVLRAELGLRDDEIRTLVDDGVVGVPDPGALP
jgi:crotonobetainyl-CoA:carnitine CoA-transferase CaiB-like acyl-CoA transferase